MASPKKLFFAAVGDIHGRFFRVEAWLRELSERRGRKLDFAVAVGDVEAFHRPDAPGRKAGKRVMPAEFGPYARGERKLPAPLYFIGGNNEDFVALHRMQEGGELSPGVEYLGRAGVRKLGGLRFAFLSGILAPKQFERPLVEPTTQETCKQAGYFRKPELAKLEGAEAEVLLVHEWPRGIIQKVKPDDPAAGLRAFKFPWAGNAVTRTLVEHVRPHWVLCGHSHTPFAATVGESTRVACLDQASKPEAAIFWMEWEGGEAVRAGWGPSGDIAWERGGKWRPACAPVVNPG